MKEFKNYKVLLISSLIVIAVFIGVIVVLLNKNQNKVKIYTSSGESENFYYCCFPLLC